MMAEKLNSKSVKRNTRSILRRYWPAYVMILPVIIWYVIFAYLPMGGLAIAFKKYNVIGGIFSSPWVGLDNFRKLFQTGTFLRSVKNTLIISALNLLFCFPIPIIFAILLNELKQLKLKKFVQTVSYLPYFISWSVVGGMVYMILSPSTGAVGTVIRTLGGIPQNYIGMKEYFRTIVVGTGIWKNMGWSAIIYMAAIPSVDEQLHEAARLDGAGRFSRIWHVTLPGIRAIIAIQLILAIGQILTVSFDQIFILITDATLEVGETIDYYIYRTGLGSSNNFSLATASGMLKSVIGLVLVVGANFVSKKMTDGEGIW